MNDRVLAEDDVEGPGIERQGTGFNQANLDPVRESRIGSDLACPDGERFLDIDTDHLPRLQIPRQYNIRTTQTTADIQ